MLDALYTLHRTDDPLLVLRAAATLRVVGEELRHHAARDAHDAGATWSEIGEALRMSRQAAHRHFAEHDEPT